MVLHLLGKKSWNVYNADNVERVRRDEAEAKAREEADEQRMQEEDAQRRIALLRGEDVAPLPEPEEAVDDGRKKRDRDDSHGHADRKRRRLRGEDDTDRDIRHARQDTDAGLRATQTLVRGSEKDAPLEDHAGNIQLIPAPDERALRKAQKNADAEADEAKKRKREEDQVTMRFSNAAGYHNGLRKPWYAAPSTKPSSLAETQGKDVWGNDDPRRKEREASRISSSDPFAVMQTAQRQLKQSERDRETWVRKQKIETEALRKHSDGLEGFSLDAPSAPSSGSRRDRDHRRRHRSRSRSRERERRRRHDDGHGHRHSHSHRHRHHDDER